MDAGPVTEAISAAEDRVSLLVAFFVPTTAMVGLVAAVEACAVAATMGGRIVVVVACIATVERLADPVSAPQVHGTKDPKRKCWHM